MPGRVQLTSAKSSRAYPGFTARSADLKVVQSSVFEDKRRSWIGGSTHVSVVAWLVAHGLYLHGLLDLPPPPPSAQLIFQQKLEVRLPEYRRYVDRMSNVHPLKQFTVSSLETSSESSPVLRFALIEGPGLRADQRGTDVRLDIGIPFKVMAWSGSGINPAKWSWRNVVCLPAPGEKEHTNTLELRAVLLACHWRLRST